MIPRFLDHTDVALRQRVRELRLVAFDFDGVFTDNSVYVMDDGREAVRCHRGDGIGLRKLDRAGIATLVISTETNPVVSERCRKLAIRCVQSCDDKLVVLLSETKKIGISLDQTAFVGNDENDLGCLKAVGLPIAVNDAHPNLDGLPLYRTSLAGGHGAVREVCDFIDTILGRVS